MATHGRDLKFLVIFGLVMGAYFAATTTEPIGGDPAQQSGFFPWYLRQTTTAAVKVLHFFGYDNVSVGGDKGNDLIGPKGNISVSRGCDAVAPTVLFLAAVLASPARRLSKLRAVIGGTLILMTVNLLRIISLYLTAVHWPRAFDVMHLDVWQAIFIFLAILLWALWASQAARPRARPSSAPV